MLEHGGALRAAARRYGRAPERWLDLSTGINPHSYPVPPVPGEYWHRLPEAEDGLEQAARAYYGVDECAALLPLAGSQAAIQCLPQLLPPGRVLMLHPCYAEHRAAWVKAGHTLVELSADQSVSQLEATARSCQAVLLCHPNNPTGLRFSPERLVTLARNLGQQESWLIVDEAFMDSEPAASLSPHAGTCFPRLVVLRSLGKFFGLAGLRVGFAIGNRELLDPLQEMLGPWTVAGPARYVAQQALRDHPWQTAMRTRLPLEARRLAGLLTAVGLSPTGGTSLFQWCPHPQAPALFETLAEQGVLTRLFRAPIPALRLGLPGGETEWQQLTIALSTLQTKWKP